MIGHFRLSQTIGPGHVQESGSFKVFEAFRHPDLIPALEQS